MPQSGPHLRIQREQPVNPRRPRHPPPSYKPENPKEHSRILFDQLQQAVANAETEIGGFDDRHLLRIQVRKGLRPEDLAALKVEVVSQEDNTIILAFADEGSLKTFESRLATIMRGEKATRQALLYALEGFSVWTEEDRTAWALRKEGFPQTDTFLLDVELWPLTSPHDQTRMTSAFESWMSKQGINKTDSIKRSTLILYRMRVNERQAQLLLRHRDVRTVDLPPRYALERTLLQLDINVLPKIPAVPRNAPGLVVLDSGIMTNHPLLRSAIGDAQSFIPNDHNVVGPHGTQVAGIALYDDVAECARTQNFIPRLRIFSGRIWDEGGTIEKNTTFVEKNIDEAVRYFKNNYDCRIFNLSFGDFRKPYLGGHIRGLAVILDELARTEGVLFVVSTGNFLETETVPQDWLRDYPDYLSTQEARLIDPAPALNVLTVGSIARTEVSFNAQRYPNDLDEQPIARRGQPSPFTRRGPSVKGAIKPELIDYGGNYSILSRAHRARPSSQGLGELSTSDQFTLGRLLSEDVGTSFAAPHVTHLAAKLLYEIPKASPNLIRALLLAHARHPEASIDLFGGDKGKLNTICGYGQVQPNALFRSLENQVTLWAEDRIENKKHHFYEIPIPEDFYSRGKRLRELTVALAHTPAVRTTRVDYKATEISFRLVEELSLDEVAASFNANTPKDEHENIRELVSNRSLAQTTRSKGTVQACTWQFKIINSSRRQKKLFLVVTRKDSGQWGSSISDKYESYALVIFLSDQEGQNVRLYTQLKNQLGLRMRARMQM